MAIQREMREELAEAQEVLDSIIEEDEANNSVKEWEIVGGGAGAYLGFRHGGCTFLADLAAPPPPPPPPPRARGKKGGL